MSSTLRLSSVVGTSNIMSKPVRHPPIALLPDSIRSGEPTQTKSRTPYPRTFPATARTLPGEACQIAIADSRLTAMPTAKAAE